MTNVLVIGGTGLLGRATAQELLEHGHSVTSLALPPETTSPLDGVSYLYRDLGATDDEELLEILSGMDAVIYAAGVDERVVPEDESAAHFFYTRNVLPTQRLARLSRTAGVTRFVLFGSYFSEFAERWEDLALRRIAGYPRTRLLQEQVAYLEGEGAMTVTSLRLPWIFGTMPGVVPLWRMFVDQIAAVPDDQPIAAPLGGTAAVTTRQVARAAVGAMERGTHATGYALGGINLRYADFYREIAEMLGLDPARVIALPAEAFTPAMAEIDRQEAAVGREHGIHLADIAEIQSRDAFIDPEPVQRALGYGEDDVVTAMRESLDRCMEARAAVG